MIPGLKGLMCKRELEQNVSNAGQTILFNDISGDEGGSGLKPGAKFPHSPILHYACGSMYVVLCFATKKQQKKRIVPQRVVCFLTLLSVNNDLHA